VLLLRRLLWRRVFLGDGAVPTAPGVHGYRQGEVLKSTAASTGVLTRRPALVCPIRNYQTKRDSGSSIEELPPLPTKDDSTEYWGKGLVKFLSHYIWLKVLAISKEA